MSIDDLCGCPADAPTHSPGCYWSNDPSPKPPAKATVEHGRVVSWEVKFEPTDTVTRGDGAPVCARDGCGLHRDWFVHNPRSKYHHPFVEPAPQPPADAATKLEFNRSAESPVPPILADNHIAPALGAAAPPVSGDGNEITAIIEGWLDRLPGVSSFDLAAIARAGLERGRALGARDERDACEQLARVAGEIRRQQADRIKARMGENADYSATADLAEELASLADAIARRPGGQGK